MSPEPSSHLTATRKAAFSIIVWVHVLLIKRPTKKKALKRLKNTLSTFLSSKFTPYAHLQITLHIIVLEQTEWPSHINVCNGKVMSNMAYCRSKFNAYCLLSCREPAILILCLCWPTVTLHQGRGHQNEDEHIWHPYKFTVMPSLNVIAYCIVRDIAS